MGLKADLMDYVTVYTKNYQQNISIHSTIDNFQYMYYNILVYKIYLPDMCKCLHLSDLLLEHRIILCSGPLTDCKNSYIRVTIFSCEIFNKKNYIETEEKRIKEMKMNTTIRFQHAHYKQLLLYFIIISLFTSQMNVFVVYISIVNFSTIISIKYFLLFSIDSRVHRD